MRTRSVVVAIAVVGVAVCGGKNQGQNITGASPTPTGLTIGPSTDLLTIKAVESFSATATYSNGSSDTVPATWASDNPTVATVEPTSGRVAGVAPGEATVAADYQGLRATRLLRVVPDYHGTWSGQHAITACRDDGMWAKVDACEEFIADSPYGFELALTQTRDLITGTADLGSPVPVEGTVRMSGHLALAGTYTERVEDLTLETTVSDWETLTMDNQRMSGQFTVRFLAPGVDGSVTITNNLQAVTKTSMTPLGRPAERGGVWRSLTAIAPRLRGR